MSNKYFTDNNSTTNNKITIIVTSLSDMLYDIYRASNAPILFDPRDSRYYYPELTKKHFQQILFIKHLLYFVKIKHLV